MPIRLAMILFCTMLSGAISHRSKSVALMRRTWMRLT
jgi:hypothetical protein